MIDRIRPRLPEKAQALSVSGRVLLFNACASSLLQLLAHFFDLSVDVMVTAPARGATSDQVPMAGRADSVAHRVAGGGAAAGGAESARPGASCAGEHVSLKPCSHIARRACRGVHCFRGRVLATATARR